MMRYEVRHIIDNDFDLIQITDSGKEVRIAQIYSWADAERIARLLGNEDRAETIILAARQFFRALEQSTNLLRGK